MNKIKSLFFIIVCFMMSIIAYSNESTKGTYDTCIKGLEFKETTFMLMNDDKYAILSVIVDYNISYDKVDEQFVMEMICLGDSINANVDVRFTNLLRSEA